MANINIIMMVRGKLLLDQVTFLDIMVKEIVGSIGVEYLIKN